MTEHWFVEKLAEPLVLFGFLGQGVFMTRFLVQWIASERRGRSYVPIQFWFISLAGGFMLFIYGVLDQDPVIMLGQSLGVGIYLRNLWMIYRRRKRIAVRRGSSEPARSEDPGSLAIGVPRGASDNK